MQKLLTIVVPVYKVEAYINKCLDSLLLSPDKMQQLEVIIVNDGTPDNSAELSREYVKRYPESFRQIDKENGGHGSAWNVGLKEATGKYVRFLDSDDWLSNLDLLMKELETTDADVVVTAMRTVNETTGDITVDCTSKTTGVLLPSDSEEFSGNKLNFWCSTYRTDLLKPLHPLFLEGVSYDDSILYIVPHFCAKTFIAFNFVLYNYLVGREGQSVSISTQVKKIPDMFANYHHIVSFAQKYGNGVDDYVEDVLAHNRWRLFNVIPYVPSYQQSAAYMKDLLRLGGLDHIGTKKYRRFRRLPYRVFHLIESRIKNH